MEKLGILRRLRAEGIIITANRIRKDDVHKVRKIIEAAKASEFTVRFGVSGSEGDSSDSAYLRQDTLKELLTLLAKKGLKEVEQDDHWCETGGAGCTLTLYGDKARFVKLVESLDPSDLDNACISIDVNEDEDEVSIMCEFDYDEDSGDGPVRYGITIKDILGKITLPIEVRKAAKKILDKLGEYKISQDGYYAIYPAHINQKILNTPEMSKLVRTLLTEDIEIKCEGEKARFWQQG